MKRGAWVVCRLYGGFGKIEVVGVFEGGGAGVGVDTPMQTMKYAITLSMILFF